MKKNYPLILLVFLCFILSSYGQITIYQESFETATGYTFPNGNGGTGQDFFDRTNLAGAPDQEVFTYNGFDGNFFIAGEDIDATLSGSIGQVLISGINISGYSSLQFRAAFASGTNIDIDDDNDAIWVEVNIDGSGWTEVGRFEADPSTTSGTGFNGEFAEDTNGDFNGDGLNLNGDFTDFTWNIAGLGNLMDVRISMNLQAGDEEAAFDNVRILGLPTCTDAVDFERLESPTTSPLTITQGNPFVVTTLATEPGVTGVPGGAPNLEAWIGYSTVDNDPSTSPGWTWVVAPYSGGAGNTDEHTADIGTGLAPGTYYYASRHRLNGCGYTYGGDVNAITFWNNDSQVLIVNPAPLADVVITEIMYNSAGADDEWIEICNVSGSPQALNSYTIEVGGTTEFTFPSSGVVLADGDCITVALGEDTGNPDFNPDCPFTPDYSNGAGTGTLNNTSDTISLIASDGSSVIDEVTYDDGDGADNTGESLHVVDVALDNSVTNTNYWEVINGGSPGINSLISPCTPVGPEINLEGNTGNFPDIGNGDITPSIFDGTDFGDVGVGSAIVNEFRIENFGGTQNLNITSVTVFSGDTGDFSITLLPPSPIAPADPNGFSIFEIEFQPTVPGVRTAVIEIRSNDADDDPYTFTVTGNGLCVANTITASPASGPVGTVVTVTGTDLATATATINGVAATVSNISATEMEVTVPAGATTGNLEILDSLGCPGSTPFTVIDSEISSCEGSGGTLPTDLFISEITDATLGGLTYVELYNGTGADINIDNYSIEVIANGAATAPAFNVFDLENVVVANGSTYVIAIGRATPVTNTNACTSELGGSGELASSANAQFTNGGINKRTNEHDVIRLVNSGTTIDEFGVYQDNDWMDSTIVTGDRGFNFRRLNTAATLPDPTFTLAELGNWAVIDWIGSGASSCSGNDYSNIGSYDFSLGTPPSVSNISSTTSACNEITINVTASEGFAGNNTLAYVWYAYDPAQSGLGWQPITNGGIYSGADTASLVITDAASVVDYQFYCEVREDDATCFTASDAIQISLSTSTWNGTNWLPAPPNINTIAILNEDYDTNIDGGSFSCCSLIINPNWELRVSNTTYVEVETDVIVENNGSIIVETQGAFVQNGDGANAGSFILNGTAFSQVNKSTSPLANWYNYTYWSSPVLNADVDVALGFSAPDRRFYFNASNFNSTIVPDIDDEGDDWTLATGTGIMLPGRGYAATHSPIGFVSGNQYEYNFEGALNTGDILYPIVNNPINTNHWNLVGNPYPSAIKVRGVDGLFNGNSGVIDQVAYLWSHSSPPLVTNPGNQNLNFNTSDYATVNASMSVPGSSGITPGNYIPSGQSFFVRSLASGNISFTNSMRIVGNNSNDLFFRQSMESSSSDKELLRINLTTEEGIFSALGVAYTASATDSFDGMAYDTKRNFTSGYPAFIYSRITNQEHKFVIQSKQINNLGINEIIPLGYRISIDEPLIYKVSLGDIEGEFLTTNSIYLKDNLLNTIHNLKDSDYNFTSEAGEFNDRFEIVFQGSALSTNEFEVNSQDLKIVELNDGRVEFSTSRNLNIQQVVILDVLGREIYRLDGNSAVEIYNLDKLSNAAYIAQVQLSNGQLITKKAIKRK